MPSLNSLLSHTSSLQCSFLKILFQICPIQSHHFTTPESTTNALFCKSLYKLRCSKRKKRVINILNSCWFNYYLLPDHSTRVLFESLHMPQAKLTLSMKRQHFIALLTCVFHAWPSPGPTKCSSRGHLPTCFPAQIMGVEITFLVQVVWMPASLYNARLGVLQWFSSGVWITNSLDLVAVNRVDLVTKESKYRFQVFYSYWGRSLQVLSVVRAKMCSVESMQLAPLYVLTEIPTMICCGADKSVYGPVW